MFNLLDKKIIILHSRNSVVWIFENISILVEKSSYLSLNNVSLINSHTQRCFQGNRRTKEVFDSFHKT